MDWRDDPGWRLVHYSLEHYGDGQLPEKPDERAELAQPPLWASLYDGHRLIATWHRAAITTTRPRATVVVEE